MFGDHMRFNFFLRSLAYHHFVSWLNNIEAGVFITDDELQNLGMISQLTTFFQDQKVLSYSAGTRRIYRVGI